MTLKYLICDIKIYFSDEIVGELIYRTNIMNEKEFNRRYFILFVLCVYQTHLYDYNVVLTNLFTHLVKL